MHVAVECIPYQFWPLAGQCRKPWGKVLDHLFIGRLVWTSWASENSFLLRIAEIRNNLLHGRTTAAVPRWQVAQIQHPLEKSAACPFIEAKSLENLFARAVDCVGRAQKIV